ncbi:hypothetical protein B0I35DRAFT_423649 [Stachybotrys elegans]|uniref:Cyclochlorotine biosynthesis protein O n=1 Tax=Stachybotrys elegans TaxID=80388 RepID=A0A8K0SX86_9HYPO|nr:hypothetical protein B0I35DRAFT_423649 [Stachybotrys elegans]
MTMTVDKQEYENEQLLGSESSRSYPATSRLRQWLPWMLHVFLIFSYTTAFFLLLSATRETGSCIERLNAYSPINDGISEQYEDYWFKGSLWYDSPYKGPPTPEVEEAWKSLMHYGAIRITADDIQKIGHNLTAAQYPPELGGGYIAVAMGTHHIHCLHYIWQDHHIDYFPETRANKEGTPEMYERHYEHCVDYLRQAIMCNFDPGIIPYYWVNKHNQPTPDGNTFHKCVNWDHLQEWLKDRAVEMPDGFKWQQPPDAVPLTKNP